MVTSDSSIGRASSAPSRHSAPNRAVYMATALAYELLPEDNGDGRRRGEMGSWTISTSSVGA